MNKKCHWSVANHLMNDGPWRLRGFALKLGSIMPDVLLYTYWTGHKFDTTADRVEQKLTRLQATGRWRLLDCFRLGYNLHFLEDYFTYPHNSNFEGGFVAHCLYEHRLSKALGNYLRRNSAAAAALPAPGESIRGVLEARHAEYMNKQPSLDNDVQYIVSTAEAVAQILFAAFSQQADSPRSQAFIARVRMQMQA